MCGEGEGDVEVMECYHACAVQASGSGVCGRGEPVERGDRPGCPLHCT